MYKFIFALLLFCGLGYSAYTYLNNVEANEAFVVTEKEYKAKQSTPDNREKVMQYARSFADETRSIKSVDELADQIEKRVSSEYEKAAYTYSWIAKNIRYDDAGFNSGKYSDMTAKGVIKNRVTVCNGFCNLFNAVSQKMGLRSEKVIGYPKGFGYQQGQRIAKADHAWNAVKVDGEWKLLDATWGSGFGKNVGGQLKTSKKYDPLWFDTDPHAFIFKHLPEDKKYQLIPNTISKKQFERLPKIKPELFDLGFGSKDLLERALRDSGFETPKGWAMDYEVEFVNPEVNKNLVSTRTYDFKIKCDADAQIVFSNGGTLKKLEKVNGYYQGSIQPARGDLTIMSRLYPAEKEFVSVLEYSVP